MISFIMLQSQSEPLEFATSFHQSWTHSHIITQISTDRIYNSSLWHISSSSHREVKWTVLNVQFSSRQQFHKNPPRYIIHNYPPPVPLSHYSRNRNFSGSSGVLRLGKHLPFLSAAFRWALRWWWCAKVCLQSPHWNGRSCWWMDRMCFFRLDRLLIILVQ